ncbi:MAG TPA: F0F1 ATP synthase subunit delta, partial [Thiothrix sp.]|nr:F0F1 ATP synthase subunit delta [Thiothrix sp.]
LTTAARPYAKAVFEMAQETGELDQWSAQLASIAAILSADGADALISNPRMTSAEKVSTIAEIAGDAINDKGVNLLRALADNDRLAIVPEIADVYEELKAAAQGSVEAELISAMAMSAEQQDAISRALEKRLGREVKLVTKIDETLMGGAIIRTGDLVIDGSIQSRLNEMKATLSR